MRNGVLLGAVLVVTHLALWTMVGGVAAQDGVKVAELGEGRLSEGTLCGAKVWLEEPASSGDEAELGMVDKPSGSGRSSAIADADSGENDDLVPVALATFGVAVAAMVVGFVAYLLRVRLGLVQAPLPPEEEHGSH